MSRSQSRSDKEREEQWIGWVVETQRERYQDQVKDEARRKKEEKDRGREKEREKEKDLKRVR